MTDTTMPLLTCPDCPAVADPDTKAVEHFDGCPVGRAIDEMTATDRRFLKSLRIAADEPAEKEVE